MPQDLFKLKGIKVDKKNVKPSMPDASDENSQEDDIDRWSEQHKLKEKYLQRQLQKEGLPTSGISQTEGRPIQKPSAVNQLMANLPKPEQINQKEEMQPDFGIYDPANYSPTGQWQPRSAIEHPATRAAYTLLPSALAPEISVGGKFIAPFSRMASRIGAGTLGNIGYEATDPNRKESISDIAKNSLSGNIIAELLPTALRTGRGTAEFINPSEKTGKLAADKIRGLYKTSVEEQQSAYKKALEPFKNTKITDKPKQYFGLTKEQKSYFTPNIKKRYDAFLDNPTVENAHKLQSQMFKDSSKMNHPSMVYNKQNIDKARESVQQKIMENLAPNKSALASYMKGSQLTKDVVSPFKSSPTLKNITSGRQESIEPKKLVNILSKGMEKEHGIPKEHILSSIMEDMQRKIGRGESIQSLIPEAAQKWIPGLGLPQNPWLNRKLEQASYPYYLGARGVIAGSNE